MEARIGIVTVSDSRFAGDRVDESGPAIMKALKPFGFELFDSALVPDEIDAIQTVLKELSQTCQIVFTTGGTGFAPRDITPEATAPLLDKRADNLCELLRLKGLEHAKLSHMSRGVAGVRGGCLIVNLPGSPKACRQGIDALAPLLPEIIASLADDGCSHAG